VPIAQINLIDEKRQWSKSSFGLERGEVPRDLSFCAHTVAGKEPLVVKDARRDARFQDNVFVQGDPKVRFYAGVPLANGRDNQMVGSLCLVDTRPRVFEEKDVKLLQDLGELVRQEFENRGRELVLENEERLNVLLAYSHSGFFDDRLTQGGCYLSPRWKEILGYADNELRNEYETFRTLVHPDDFAMTAGMLAPHAEGVHPFSFECRMRHKDGRWIWVESRGVVAADPDLKPTRYLGFITEITGRRENMARLELLENCFDRLGQGIMITDAELAPAHLSILYANPAFLKLTGFAWDDLVGKDPFLLGGPYQDKAVLIERLFREQKNYVFEGKTSRQDGSALRGSWTVSPLPDEVGRLTHLITTLRDLDEA
jgi:PAS domain S-box-containing protein